ncbi:unnamed protein product [Ectocarpus sp. 12 AP-2014]
MKFFMAFTLLGLAWAATANPEEEHMERKLKTAEMVSHMNRHLRDAGEGRFSRKEAAQLKRQAREEELQSKKTSKESAKGAMRAEKMRRAAEHVGDREEQNVIQETNDREGPDVRKVERRKRKPPNLARDMSHGFDPAAVHEAMSRRPPGAHETAHEPHASARTGHQVPHSRRKKLNAADVKKAQHNLAKAAHAMHKAGHEDAQVGAAEPAEDGEE